MAAATSSGDSTVKLSQSPLWIDLLAQAQSRLVGSQQIVGSGSPSLEGMASTVARAHSRLLVALERDHQLGEDTVWQLVAEAVQVLICAANVGALFGRLGTDGRSWLADQLLRRLACHEDAVLAGEVTYSTWSEQADKPAARMRQAITRLSRNPTSPQAELTSLWVAAVDLASVLIRLAGNARASGRGRDAPEERTPALTAALRTVTGELAARAQHVAPVNGHGDVVAHHLAVALRLRVSQQTLRGLAAGSPIEQTVSPPPPSLRDAWVAIAANEYVAVAALDAQLDKPCYATRFHSLPEAISEPAANVICGARLGSRPGAFRHDRALRQQAVALTYAIEAYVAGVRGHARSLAQAQAITLTRLVRAAIAITTIDQARAQPQPISEPTGGGVG